MIRLNSAFCTALGIYFALLPFAGARSANDKRESFKAQSAAAQALTDEGQWEEAHAAWLEVLRGHAGASYVVASLPDIRLALQRAAFWSEHKRPDPKGLVSGKLLSYSRSSGKIRIRYGPEQFKDFEKVADYLLHPLQFRGNYTIEVKGLPAALAGVRFLVGMEGNEGYMVQVGNFAEGSALYTLHQLLRLSDGNAKRLDSSDPRERKAKDDSKSVKLKISVGDSNIRVTYNNRSVLAGRKETEALGQFGIAGGRGFEELTITGVAEMAWVEGLVDRSVQDERDAFNAGYEDPVEFGAWTIVEPVVRSKDLVEIAGRIPLPDMFTKPQAKSLLEITELINAGLYDEAEQRLGKSGANELPPATSSLLLFISSLRQERFDQALTHSDSLMGMIEPNSNLQQTAVALRFRVERYEEAIEQLNQALVQFPEEIWPFAELALALMLEGRFDEARSKVDAGLRHSPADAELNQLREQVAKASQGPSWQRSFDEEGDYFHAFSDINSKSTRLVSREAEDALAYFSERFGEIPAEKRKLKLYLFSGESSYSAYIEGVEDDSLENTAGIFSPRLKQILIWNQPDREQLFSVVRHEVMHAYVDRALGSVPIWFSEGVAEYFAAAKLEDRRWNEGAPAPDHLAVFQAYGLKKVTVKQFIFFNNPNFMLNAEYTYPMAWAFVDFLLNSTAENQAYFDALWDLLKTDINGADATHQIFDSVDLDKLDAEFWEHLKQKL